MRPAAWMAAVAAAIAIPLTLYPAPSAGASHVGAVRSKTVAIGYGPAVNFNSRPLHRCVTIVLGGFISYKFSSSGGTSSWTDQRLVKPFVVIVFRKLSHGKCGAQAKVTGIQLTQFWDGAKCQFNPAMTTVKPWTLVTGTWPGCGTEKRRQASYSAPRQNHARSTYVIRNKGVKVKFAPFSEPGRPVNPPCYAISVTGTIYNGNSSDSFGGEPSDVTKRICLRRT